MLKRWRLSDIRLPLERDDERHLLLETARVLGLAPEELCGLKVARRAIDARKRPALFVVYTVEFALHGAAADQLDAARIPKLVAVQSAPPAVMTRVQRPCRALVVGMGPAGLFAAWRLVRAGVSVTLLERGCAVEERIGQVRSFWQDGTLDPESNVQFGEGGAGTFSDGKLTTRLNHPSMRLILETLVDFGAPEQILVDAKPHIGTDRLRRLLRNFRTFLLAQGVVIHFRTRMEDFMCVEGRVRAVRTASGAELPCDALVLAPGHSARDTYRMLAEAGVALEPKPFAVGARVEHPAELINRIQYGIARHPRLGAADYALTHNRAADGRGVYSFCMCPGGEVITAASEPQALVVNGMSALSRAGDYSNSALVVTVRPDDFAEPGPLGGVAFQRQLEQAAFRAGGENYWAPAQNLMSFLGRGGGGVRSTCRPGVTQADLGAILPDFVARGLREALPRFDQRMRGFVTAEANLIGVETRTSAPLRIVRDPQGQSVSHPGLYPCGEGAGYAGGIMSAALDGIRIAEAIITNFQQQES